MIRTIVCEPNPTLRRRAEEVVFDDQIKNRISDMKETLLFQKDPEGIGLAAPQIGVSSRIIVVRDICATDKCDQEKILTLANPKVVSKSHQTDKEYEGCLSVPGKYGLVERPVRVKVLALGESGHLLKIKAEGLLARTILHEIDHLDGVLFIDRAEGKLLSDEEMEIILDGEEGTKLQVALMGNTKHIIQVAQGLLLNPTIKIVLLASQSTGRDIDHIQGFATSNNIRHEIIQDMGEKTRALLESISPDFLIVADFGLKVTPEILSIPKFESLNIHPSILPKFRGPSPAQATIMGGCRTGGVTIIQMDEGFDTGAIYYQEEISLSPQETAESLYSKAYKIASEEAGELMKKIVAGEANPTPQEKVGATYTKKLRRGDGKIDWGRHTNVYISRAVRAYNPFPGAWTTIGETRKHYLKEGYVKQKSDGKRLVIVECSQEGHSSIPEITKVQIEGKKPISWKEFTAGYLY